MDVNTLLSQTLELGSQPKVVKSEIDVPQRQLRLELDFPVETKFVGPRCGQFSAVDDTTDKEAPHRCAGAGATGEFYRKRSIAGGSALGAGW